MRRPAWQLGIIVSAVAVAAAGVPQARAQDESVQEEQRGLDDIIVTARRVEERLQDVPIAVTALNADGLRKNNVERVSDLRLTTPSMQITPSGNGVALPSILLRGQRASRTLFGQDPPVAVYFNEFGQTRAAGLDATAFDLSSVQVLKGPQGTLFGRNTTGGALVITPQRPTDLVEGFIEGEIQNFDGVSLTGALNLPISDSLKLRVAGSRVRRDGYVRNVATGQDLFDQNSSAFRASLLFESGAVESLTVVDGFWSDSNSSLAHCVFYTPGGLMDQRYGATFRDSCERTMARDIRKVESNKRAFETTDSIGISNVTTFALSDALTIKNVAGWKKVKNVTLGDYDGTVADALASTNLLKGQWASEELQLVGKYDNLDFIVGGFFYHETGTDTAETENLRPPGSDLINHTGGFGRNRSVSVFGQATVKLDNLVEGLSVTAGGRYTWDRRRITAEDQTSGTIPTLTQTCGVRDTNNVPLPFANCQRTESVSFKEPTYTLSLNWKASRDMLLYVAHRRGYRSGGINVRAKNNPDFIPFRPEIVKDVEIGLKSDFDLGGVALRTNIAAYHQWYEDIQRVVAVLINGQTGNTVINAAKATIKGLEVEATLVPGGGFQLSGYYAYTKPKYQSYLNPTTGADLSSNQFSDVPRHQGSITASYDMPLEDDKGEISASATLYAQSGFEFSDINVPGARAPNYKLLNARLEWRRFLGSDVDLAVFGRNLTNEDYILSGSNVAALGVFYAYPGPPRTYGLEARYSF